MNRSTPAPDTLGQRQGRPWALFGHVLLALAAFALVAHGIGRVMPWPEEYGLRAKFEHYSAHHDRYDAVFIGSSRVFRSFDPAEFDAELARRGFDVRSFNFGVGGMGTFERDYLLREIVALRPTTLRWIFMEGGEWDPAFYFLGNTYSTRSVFWHSPDQTAAVLRSVTLSDEPLNRKLELWLTHLQLCAWKVSNFGQGHRIFGALSGTSRDVLGRALSEEELEAGRGYQSLEDLAGREFSEAHLRLMEDAARYEAAVADIARQNEVPLDPARYNFEALEEQIALARSLGAEIVYAIPPGNEGTPELLRLNEQGHIPLLFDLNSPERYPELFRLDHRFDERHLNRRGAVEFSRALARAFAEHLRSGS